MSNVGGRPLKFGSVEELKEKINAYFYACDQKSIPYTITGLALALNTNRQTLLNYEEKEGFFDTINTAKTIVENYYERHLFGANVSGIIFGLKNFGWQDKSELDTNNKHEMVNWPLPKSTLDA